MIPLKIHYCWFGPKPLPKIAKKCIRTWKEHFPGYKFVLWNEHNSPMDVPYVKEAYAQKKYAFVSDYVRFWALYNEGGTYLDTDMFFIRPMTNLMILECFFSWEDKEQINISCGVIGSIPENPFIKDVLDEFEGIHFNKVDLENLIIPRLITRIYSKSDYKDHVSLLQYDLFYPFPYEKRDDVKNFRSYATENTYGIHLWNLSWISAFDKFLSKTVKFLKNF